MPTLSIRRPFTRDIPIPVAGALTLGRDSANEIQLNDPTVSLRHAEIRLENGIAVVRDLQSTNGTKVNGNLIDQIQLRNADQIFFGGVEAVYQSLKIGGTEDVETPSKRRKNKKWMFASAAILCLIVGAMLAKKPVKSVRGPAAAKDGGLTASRELPREPEHKATTFQDLVAAFFAPHRKTLAGDIQGFQFGSDVNAVVQNFEAQYQQKLDPTMTKTAAFSFLDARLSGSAKQASQEHNERWTMQFGFADDRLVYINKGRWTGPDPEKLAAMLKDRFQINGDNDRNYYSAGWLIASDSYAGYVYPDGYELFERKFIEELLQRKLQSRFTAFLETIKKTDFTKPPQLGYYRDLHMRFEDFQDVKLPEDVRGDALSTYVKLKRDWVVDMLQALYPPESGKIERTETTRGSSRLVDLNWKASGNFFVHLNYNQQIAIGKKQEPPDPDKL